MDKAMDLIGGMAKSKTVLFNGLFLVVLIANQLGFADFQPNETLVVVGNLVLRLMTTTALWEK